MKRIATWFGLVIVLAASTAAFAGGGPVHGQNGDATPVTEVIPANCNYDFDVTSLPYANSSVVSGDDCGRRPSNDHIYRITIPGSGLYTFSTCGTTAPTDVHLYLLTGCCDGRQISTDDDGCGMLHGPAVIECVWLTESMYYLVVEAEAASAAPYYTLTIAQCANPCVAMGEVPDGLHQIGDARFYFAQHVNAGSPDSLYDGPFNNPAPCVSGEHDYGFGYLCWYDDDFGWNHTFPLAGLQGDICFTVDSAFVAICAWDVDFRNCDQPPSLDDAQGCEFDAVYGDGQRLIPNYLHGTNLSWSVTGFRLDPGVLEDGLLAMRVDFDEYARNCNWAARVQNSLLLVFMHGRPCNRPPYQPEGVHSGCVTTDSAMCVTVTGPIPPDPDLDQVTYVYNWYKWDPIDQLWVFQSQYADSCVPPSANELGDSWRVEVVAIDEHQARSIPWVVEFIVVGDCGSNPVVGWDYGDLDPQCYPTGTQQTGGPANPVREQNVAWLGAAVSADASPMVPNLDTYDDGVLFLNRPWEPCSWVCVSVTVTAGPGYSPRIPLFLWGWKDGNLDCDFIDQRCMGPQGLPGSEVIIAGVELPPLYPDVGNTFQFCFTDPGVTYLGIYAGVFRFRLITEELTAAQALVSVDPIGGETEDYVESDLQLYVNLLDFTAVQDGNSVMLNWSTASEQNNDHFTIERRTSRGWESIAPRIAAAGNSPTEHHYQYRDSDVQLGTTYEYRLIAVDVSGVAEVLSTSRVSVVELDPLVIEDCRLYPNYPNPFNPTTTITFDLKESGHVTLTVFDMTGRTAAVLVNGHRSSGRYHVTFDAKGLPTGLYFYRLTAPGFSDMKKMILLK
jgi:hypothetical protein